MINIEIAKGDRLYRVGIPSGAPFGESFDALFEAMEIVKGWHEKAQLQLKESRPVDLAEPVQTEPVEAELVEEKSK